MRSRGSECALATPESGDIVLLICCSRKLYRFGRERWGWYLRNPSHSVMAMRRKYIFPCKGGDGGEIGIDFFFFKLTPFIGSNKLLTCTLVRRATPNA